MESKKELILKLKKGFNQTNYFKPINEVVDNLKNKIITLDELDGNCFFLEKTRYDFYRLYYYIAVKESLEGRKLSNKVNTVCEVLHRKSKESGLKFIEYFLQNNGFKPYSEFNRMSLLKNNKVVLEKAPIISYPKDEDLKEIQTLLENNFDIYSEQIPSIDELKELKASTYLIRDNEKIVALLISQKKGQTEELRYWFVLKEYQGKKFGGVLMKYFLNAHTDVNRYLLWVNVANSNAINKYEYYGFKKEDMYNKIYLKNGRNNN